MFPFRHGALIACIACGTITGPDEAEPTRTFESIEQGLVTCDEHTDTGYTNGNTFTITLVTADGKPIELATANAYAVMQDAAAADGVSLVVVSGFRTMAEQQYLYACYVNCNCNSCNLAAQPGYSNHQSGHALDLNTSDPGVYSWLTAHGGAFGFARTVPSEIWHWEWWSGGPGGGPCGNTDDNCTHAEADGCGHFGCGCVDHQCNGVFCPGSGCSAQHTSNCGAFGCGCADGQCNGGTCPGGGCTAKEAMDCAAFGSGCVDHACNGGTSPGTGCTWRETHDCGAFGAGCVDHQCNGGTAPGTGCTWRETHDCQATGCGCADHQCSGGQCAGTDCTWRETHDCAAFGVSCLDHMCVAPDAGRPFVPDAGLWLVESTLSPATIAIADESAPPVSKKPSSGQRLTGGCSAAPGPALLLIAIGMFGARRRTARRPMRA